MKIPTVAVLAGLLALAPAVQAQRRSGPPADRPPVNNERPPAETDRPAFRTEAPRRPPTPNLPTSPILPMTNPIIPITNPVQPVIRYGVGGTPTVVIPPTTVPNRTSDRPRDRRGNVPVVIVGGPYVGPYVSPDYLYYPYVPPAPVPGELPGVYREREPSVIYVPVPGPATNMAPVQQEPIYYPEPNIIITPPEPERILQPPALGTSRVDVIARYGQPWGSIWARGKETLYFTGGLTLVLEDGRVTQIR